MTTRAKPESKADPSDSHVVHYDIITRLCDIFDDMEHVVIANANRVRSLTQGGLGETSETRLLRDTVDVLRRQQDVVELELKRALRKHPLAPWLKSITGVGEKQGARLLGALGDPYWNSYSHKSDCKCGNCPDPAGRPRRGPAELWAYCGLHTLPIDQPAADVLTHRVDGNTTGSHVDHASHDAQAVGINVAARKQRGQRANWNATAKMRVYLIAEKCVMNTGEPYVITKGKRAGQTVQCARSQYRDIYDKRKENTIGRVHAALCYRCGPKDHPAKPGTPWSDAHRHADALRIVSKRILRDMWRESKRLHELLADQRGNDTHLPFVGERQLPIDQTRTDTQPRYVGGNQLEVTE